MIARARDIMGKLEGGAVDHRGWTGGPQLSLLPSAPPSPVLARLAAIDPDRTTPLEALALLAELRRML